MNPEKIRIAVLGAGRIGKVHISNLTSRISGAEVVAVADISAEMAASVARQYAVHEVAADYRELLRRPDVDAVAVCTPTNTHYEVIREAAAAGKHIFCEKPVDLSLDRIRKVNQHVESTGVQLMVGFNRRFDPNFQKLHHTVQAGKI